MKRIFLFAALLMTTPLMALDDNAYQYSQGVSTRTICTAPCTLYAVTVTSNVGTAFVLYDSTHSAGTSVEIAPFASDATERTYLFNIRTQNGLQLNGAANGNEVTVSYR